MALSETLKWTALYTLQVTVSLLVGLFLIQIISFLP